MTNLMPVSKPNSDAPNPVAAPSNERELVGRRGTAPAEDSRAATAYLVAGKAEKPLRERFDRGRACDCGNDIAADDRQRVLETDLTPWRMVCALRLRSPTGAVATGTGWLAGPRTVITAGHCVHHQGFHGGWADSIEVSAGRNGATFPFSRFTATRFATVDRWAEAADPDFDIGCIRLDRPLGEMVGWFGAASLTPSELESTLVNSSDYPADRGDGTQQYFQANRIRRADDKRIIYDVDTDGTQSGAPVWIHRTPSAPPVVVAVQSHGTDGAPFDPGVPSNAAPRFTPEIFDLIRAWVHQDISVLT